MTTRDLSPWRRFPHAILASLFVVILVNGLLAYLALHSFPGSAGQDGFDLGRAYEHILEADARQQSLGWQTTVSAGTDGRAILRLSAGNNAALTGATAHVVAARPVGPEDRRELAFEQSGDALRSTTLLPRGQWMLTVDVSRDADHLTRTERLVVP